MEFKQEENKENHLIINGKPITNSTYNFFINRNILQLETHLKELNFHLSNLIERKKIIQYFIDIKKIQRKQENKQKMIYEDTTDDIYFPSLSEVASKIENNEDLNLQRKRTLIIENDDENKENKKQIVEINGELFIRKDDKFIKYEQK